MVFKSSLYELTKDECQFRFKRGTYEDNIRRVKAISSIFVEVKNISNEFLSLNKILNAKKTATLPPSHSLRASYTA